MTPFSLPADIVYLIFMKLDSIDDCLHLARSCQRWYTIFDQYRLRILKSAIMQSHAHQHDIRLCHFIDTYWVWASQYLQNGLADDNPASVEAHYQPAVVTSCLRADTLSDQHVWDIVARWQGLAVLQDIYRHPFVFESYCRYPLIDMESQFFFPDGPEQMREILEHQPDIDVLQEDFNNLSRRHDEIFPQLYLALTRYWLLCEAMRLAKICTYSRQSEEHMIWKEIYSFCTSGMSLLEAMQVLEAYDFTFDYLVGQLQCAKAGTFTDWIKEGNFLYENETIESNWVFFLHYLRISLSPADVIELSIISHHWRQNCGKVLEWSPDRKCRYLKERLFFGYRFPGRVWTNDVGESPDTHYTVKNLEKAVELKLNVHPTVSERPWQRIWQVYRRNGWVTDARGEILSWKCSDQMLASRIRGIANQL